MTTRILALFWQHQAILRKADAHVFQGDDPRQEDDELDRLFYDEADRLSAEMMAEPCTCAADFAAKALVDTSNGRMICDGQTAPLWQEARELVRFQNGQSRPGHNVHFPNAPDETCYGHVEEHVMQLHRLLIIQGDYIARVSPPWVGRLEAMNTALRRALEDFAALLDAYYAPPGEAVSTVSGLGTGP